MDLGNIVYIVAVIGYFIYQATRKKKDQEMPPAGEDSFPEPKKGMSFEDLLKEIREAQKPLGEERIPQSQTPKPSPTPVALPRAKPVARKPVLVEADDEEAIYYKEAFAATQSNPHQASKDVHSLQTAPTVKFNYAAMEGNKVNRYAELLKNPKTLKDAMIVSEILKPKFF